MPSMEWRKGPTSSDVHDLDLEKGMVCDVSIEKIASKMLVLTALDPATGRTTRMLYKTPEDVRRDWKEVQDEH